MTQPDNKPAPELRSAGPNAGRRSTARESDWIGRKLNQVYNQTLAEPLPAQFMALIEAISDRERASEEFIEELSRTAPMATSAHADDMSTQLITALPMLRAFARSLSGDRVRADDLVQETIARALANKDKFTPGTNLNAWLVTILRNHFYSEGRKRRREVEDADGQFAGTLADLPGQESHLDMADFRNALAQLADEQREALILVGASGFSYEEAADICGVRVGTIKSRVSRARVRLLELLGTTPTGPAAADIVSVPAMRG